MLQSHLPFDSLDYDSGMCCAQRSMNSSSEHSTSTLRRSFLSLKQNLRAVFFSLQNRTQLFFPGWCGAKFLRGCLPSHIDAGTPARPSEE